MPSKTHEQRDKDFSFKTTIKECEQCSTPIKLINTRDLERKRFCSQDCKKLSQVGKRPTGEIYKRIACKCSQCNIDFIAINKANKFCSSRCQAQAGTNRYNKEHNSVSYFLRQLRNKGSERNLKLDFLISLYEKQKGLCAISGVEMTWIIQSGKIATNISIDRINPLEGYVENNVQLTCYIVNIMKHNTPQNEFINWCKKILENSLAK